MIIKEFAKLCNCNPQTLRYYDSIDLLKPVKVDYYTGYRHYSAEQALQYLKIKKLQDALFTIEEIRDLLDASDDIIFEALNKKIVVQQAKLKEMKSIQKSYQKDIKEMKEKIENFKESLMKDAMSLDYKKEFGISQDEYFEIINGLNDLADKSLTNEDISVDIETDIEFDGKFEVTDDYKLFYESTGFTTISEVLKNVPQLDKGNYYIHINHDEKYKGTFAFPGVVAELICRNHIKGKGILVEFHFDFELGDRFFRIYKK